MKIEERLSKVEEQLKELISAEIGWLTDKNGVKTASASYTDKEGKRFCWVNMKKVYQKAGRNEI